MSEEQAERIAKALESIASSLLKIANPARVTYPTRNPDARYLDGTPRGLRMSEMDSI